jgi:putative phosphoribosyl transferase
MTGLPQAQRFADRCAAGLQLARALRGQELPASLLVLGLPRGGVPVAAQVARELGARLDALLVRKIGLPMQPEFAIGAIASGGILVRDRAALRASGLSEAEFDALVRREGAELERREQLYRRGHPALRLRGRAVLIVDDGVATGSTMLAAVRAARAAGASWVAVAAPVASVEAVARLQAEADALVILQTPAMFQAVGEWYEQFPQTSDAEVREYLQSGQRTAQAEPAQVPGTADAPGAAGAGAGGAATCAYSARRPRSAT